MTAFTSQFAKLSLPNLGLVRFPQVTIAEQDKATLGLKPTADNRTVLKHLAWAGYQALKAKGAFAGIDEAVVIERFKTEFATFDKTGVHDYLLLVWDYCRWAQQQGIVSGWGRGSAGGSLVNQCLGIVRVNPLRYRLDFPRFISEARMKPVVKDGVTYVDGKTAPDIDCDYQYGRRAEVVNYIEQTYPGRTCRISTRMELTGKMALKTALKVYADWKDEDAQRVSDMIEARFGKVQGLHEARHGDGKDKPPNDAIIKWIAASKVNEDIYNVAMAIEGLAVGKGQHPSGVFIGYHPLDGTVPVEVAKEKGGVPTLVTSYDMETMAGIGVKVDILGVRTLDLVAGTANLVGENLMDLDVEDPIIYRYIAEHDTYVGLFQIEDGTTKDAARRVGPRNLEELAAVVAISRPGALSYLDQLVTYVKTGVIKPFYPSIDAILRPTGGALIMQEQITEVCRDVLGMSGVDADSVRYACGKKKREDMLKWEDVIRANGAARGIPKDVIDTFWATCLASADYSFNQCLHPLTTVITQLRGPQAMTDVRVGERVLAYDTDSATDHYVEVLALHWGESKPMYCARTFGGHEVVCSLDHKLLCTDGQMRRLEDVWMERCPLHVKDWAITDDDDTVLRSVEEQPPVVTLDLEVAHPDHLFYANGISVSNSHAIEYSCLTAATTSQKARHPLAFYVTMLRLAKEEPNPTEYLNTIIAEMTRAGFRLLPPDILRSEMDFTIEGDAIRYGLASIKGISEATFAKLTDLRGKAFETKFALFDQTKAAHIQINMLTGLIYAGAISWPGTSRIKLALDAQTYNLLTDNQKLKVKQYGLQHGTDDIIEILRALPTVKNEKGTPLMAESQMETLRRKYLPYYELYLGNVKHEKLASYIMERSLLGWSYTSSLWEVYSERINGLVPVADVKARGEAFAKQTPPEDGERVRQDPITFVAFVDELKAGASKANGTPYLRGMVSDDTGSIMLMCYGAERVEACRSFNGRLPEPDDIVLVKGVFSRDGRLVFSDSLIIQPCPVRLKKAKDDSIPV